MLERLKKSMSTDPVLALPDMMKPFEVHTDASDFLDDLFG